VNSLLWVSIKQALSLLSKRDKRLLILATIAQMLLSLLDLAGVLLLGLVAAAAAGAATGTPLNVGGLSVVNDLLPTDATATILLAFIAAVLLVSKSVIGLLLTRRIFRFIANRQAVIAGKLAERLLNRPLLELQGRSSQETTIALTSGTNAITLGTLGPTVVIAAESALIFSLAAGLLFVDAFVAGFTVIFFGLIILVLQKILGSWAQSLGFRLSTAEIGSMESIQHALRTYREVTVTGRRGLFISRFQALRWEAAAVQADIFVMNQVGKYVFEVGLVIGGGLLVLVMSITRDVTAAVAIITVFLAASSRLFPALLRLQTAMVTIRQSSGTAEYTYRMINELTEAEKSYSPPPIPQTSALEFNEAVHAGFPGFTARVDCH